MPENLAMPMKESCPVSGRTFAAPAQSTPAVEFRNIAISYGNFAAVRDFSLCIEKGSFVTLLGPSGCGKTTILRSIAGLVDIARGQILINGRRIDQIPIYQRNIGLVFQNYALFPHKSVFENVAFGLKYRGVTKAEIANRVARALDMVRLPNSEKKLPSQLSGGQQQRIALARAIVFEPEVLLLDEPLSALDANMREEMRVEIKKIQKQTGITAIFVTHDQEEALSMSDRIVVMNAGVSEQMGSPQEVYETPSTAFVAGFLGKANMLKGVVLESAGRTLSIVLAHGQAVEVETQRSIPDGTAITIVVRPQKLSVSRPNATNILSGKVMSTSYLGSGALYEIDIGAEALIRVATPIDGRVAGEGEILDVGFEPADCVLLDERGVRIV